jgi:hypothetical protein
MRYWWVNQNQTHRAEIKGEFMWSPKTNANGARNQFYENMRLVAPGDIVFSFWDTRIKAVGLAVGTAQTGPKPPEFGSAGWNWNEEGWFVPVSYLRFDDPIRPKDHIVSLRQVLPPRYSPLRSNGDGLQSVYLAELPEPLASALIGIIGQAYFEAIALLTEFPRSPDVDDSEVDLPRETPSTMAEQVVRARRGQGMFRASVLLIEKDCRVTHVADPRHLRASHIKPWRDASNEERLNGSNGLLLSPHVDHLFDQGYITFSNSEQLLMVPDVRVNLLDKWGIDAGARVGEFSREQKTFLDYHRSNVFRGTG